MRIALTLKLGDGFSAYYSFTIESEKAGAYHVAEEECRVFTDDGAEVVIAVFENGELQPQSFIRTSDMEPIAATISPPWRSSPCNRAEP